MSAPLQQLLAVSALIAALEVARDKGSLDRSAVDAINNVIARAKRTFEMSQESHNDNVGAPV